MIVRNLSVALGCAALVLLVREAAFTQLRPHTRAQLPAAVKTTREQATEEARTMYKNGRLNARPSSRATPGPWRPGTFALDLVASGRDGMLHVPKSVAAHDRAPVLILLHGAGGRAPGMVDWFDRVAERWGVVLLAPDSRASTWDLMASELGPDVAFMDRALANVLERYPVDVERLAIAGFSDGASYALSLGLANGDVIGQVLAFSPGFAAPPALVGKPRAFVSHGLEDRVLPIGPCSRKLVPKLRAAGLTVDYREFEGAHTIPPRIMERGFTWWLGDPPSRQPVKK